MRVSSLLRIFQPQYFHQRIGLGFVAVGMMILISTVAMAPSVATLDCQRKEDYYSVCLLQNRSLLGLPVRQMTLDPLEGSQPFPIPTIPGWSNQVMLYQSGHPFTFSRFSGDEVSVMRSVEAINAFLGNPQISTFHYDLVVPFPILLTILLGTLSFLAVGLVLLKIAG
jgi:hypothetical protein